MAWDTRYRPLKEGEIISGTDECLTDTHLGWQPVLHTAGKRAPDPAYTAHRMYRRLKTDAEREEGAERADMHSDLRRAGDE
jgi:hypothetical protein